jgi:hypothetical protein
VHLQHHQHCMQVVQAKDCVRTGVLLLPPLLPRLLL